MRFFFNNKLEITIESRAPSNTGSFFLMLIILMKWTLIFHFFGFSWSQIFSCIYPNCPSSSSFGSFVFECPCWWQLWAPWFHVIFLFVLQFQCKLSYTHQHLLDEGLLPSCASWATITLWGPSPNCPLQGQLFYKTSRFSSQICFLHSIIQYFYTHGVCLNAQAECRYSNSNKQYISMFCANPDAIWQYALSLLCRYNM